MRRFLVTSALALVALAAAPALAPAATPSPRVTGHAPTVPMHAVVTVKTNSKGQVTSAVLTKPSISEMWNLNVFGNAQQMFIRSSDGSAIAGTYTVPYDYSPTTKRVTRGEPELVQAGGVDPNAPGLVDVAKQKGLLHTAPPTK